MAQIQPTQSFAMLSLGKKNPSTSEGFLGQLFTSSNNVQSYKLLQRVRHSLE